MALSDIIKLSLKYLLRYKRRYIFLFCALGLGFSIITSINAIKEAMSVNIYNAARGHYSGDFVLKAVDTLSANDIDMINESVAGSGAAVSYVAPRTQIIRSELFFNGEYISLKYMVGVDWLAEKDYFASLQYSETAGAPPDDSSLILSTAIARRLGVHPGDAITMLVERDSGQIDTFNFILNASINDSSIFGYAKGFASRNTINSIFGYNEGDCTSAGIALHDTKRLREKGKLLRDAINARLPVTEVFYDNDWTYAQAEAAGEAAVFLSVYAFIYEISQLFDALDILILFLYVMMLLIIAFSSGVTYSLIINERLRETGTMRAIGFSSADIRALLYSETFFLGTLSIIAGLLLSFVFTFLCSLLDFSWFPSFEIFLDKGKLRPFYSLNSILFNVVSIYIVLSFAVLHSINRVSRVPLCDVLSGAKG